MKKATANIITREEVMQNSTMSGLREAILFLEKNKETIFFPKKYMSALKNVVARKVVKMVREEPEMPLLKVVIASLDGLNENLPAEMITEITDFIIQERQRLSLSKQENVIEKTSVKMYAPIPELYAVANEDGVNNDVSAVH